MGRVRGVQPKLTGKHFEHMIMDDLEKEYGDFKEPHDDRLDALTYAHSIELDGALIANKRILRRKRMNKYLGYFLLAVIIGAILYALVSTALIMFGPRT